VKPCKAVPSALGTGRSRPISRLSPDF
jgi:hypothetical protein